MSVLLLTTELSGDRKETAGARPCAGGEVEGQRCPTCGVTIYPGIDTSPCRLDYTHGGEKCGVELMQEVDQDLLDERRLVRPDLTIDHRVVAAIAGYRAQREFDAGMGEFHVLVGEEGRRLIEQAEMMIELRKERAKVEALPLRERLIAHLQWQVTRLEHAAVRDDGAIAHFEGLLAQAKRAAADDAGVKLAGMLAGRV